MRGPDRVLGAEEAQGAHGRGAGGGLTGAERAAVDQHGVVAGQLAGDGEAGERRTDDRRSPAPRLRLGGHGDESYRTLPAVGRRRVRHETGQRVRILRPGGRMHDELQVGRLERREGRPLQAQRAHHGVLEGARARLRHGHLVPRPEGAEGLRRLGHLLHAGAHGGVAGVQVERRTGLGDEVRALGLQVEQQAGQVLVHEQQVQQVAVLRRHRRERREQGRLRRRSRPARRGSGRRASRARAAARRAGAAAASRSTSSPPAPGAGAWPARCMAWARSAGVSRSARASASSTSRDGRAARPCSISVSHAVLTPAIAATSSRRSPRARRRPVDSSAERLRGDALAAGAQQVAQGAAAEGVVHRPHGRAGTTTAITLDVGRPHPSERLPGRASSLRTHA